MRKTQNAFADYVIYLYKKIPRVLEKISIHSLGQLIQRQEQQKRVLLNKIELGRQPVKCASDLFVTGAVFYFYYIRDRVWAIEHPF